MLEQAANISPNSKTGRFCNEHKLFYFTNELNLSDKLMEYSFKNWAETFNSCQIRNSFSVCPRIFWHHNFTECEKEVNINTRHNKGLEVPL